MADVLTVTIKHVDNGFLVAKTLNYEESHEERTTVIEESEDDNLRAIENLLLTLLELFGQTGGRYDKERIHIVRVAGDKYEPNGDERMIRRHYYQVVSKRRRK